MFAPIVGINEEAATGMAAGALACYLYFHGLARNPDSLTFEQGYFMNRPSTIEVQLQLESKNITNVLGGGKAVQSGCSFIDVS